MQEWQREVVMVDPATLVPHPRRDEAGDRYDNEEALENLPPNLVSLQANILQNGIREPLLVQSGTNILMTGHFRRAVALQAEWTEVPVEYFNISNEEAYVIMLGDNWERNESIMDDPMAVAKNMYYFAMRLKIENVGTQYRDEDIPIFPVGIISVVGKKFDKTRSTVRRYFQLLKLVPELQQWISLKRIGVEGGALLSNMSEKAQCDFLRDYANYPKVSDLEIKSFRDTWKDITEEQKEMMVQETTAQINGIIPTDDNDAEIVEEEEIDPADFDGDDEAGGEDSGNYQDELTGGAVQDESIISFQIDPSELPSISVVGDPKHRTLHMRNKLTHLVKRQKGTVHRMNNELRELIDGLQEDTEEQGLLYVMEDVDQLEFDVQTMLDLIKKAKAQHYEAVNRHSGAASQGV